MKPTDKHLVTRESVFQIQVCSEGTYDEALEWLRKNSPAGTQNNWQKDERECVAPVKCEQCPERTHYVFVC